MFSGLTEEEVEKEMKSKSAAPKKVAIFLIIIAIALIGALLFHKEADFIPTDATYVELVGNWHK